jgi:hypothetical protein
MLRKRKPQERVPYSRGSFDGVFFDRRRNVVSLKRTVTIEVDKAWLFSVKRFFLNPVFFAGLLVLALLCIVARPLFTRAEEPLYPHSCLGGWQNPEQASGIPEVLGKDSAVFSTQNSASVSGALAEIYCGDFQGNIPDKTIPTKISIKFSWAIAQKSLPTFITLPVATSTDILGNASSTNAILDTASTTNAELVAPLPQATDTTSTILPPPQTESGENPPINPTPEETPPPSIPETAPTPDVPTPTPDTAPAPPADSSPQSFLIRTKVFANGLFETPIAYAEEITTTTVADTSLSNTDATTTQASSTVTTTTLSAPTTDDVLEVSYTLDGSTWIILGRFTRETFAGVSVDVPNGNIHSWSDLSKLQVSVRTLSGIGEGETLYLDGLVLVVDYTSLDPSAPEQEPKNTFLRVTSLPHQGTKVTGSLMEEGTEESLIFKGVSGSGFRFYNLTDPTFSLIIGVGDTPVTMADNFFGSGDFVLVDTSEKNICASLTLTECRANNDFLDEIAFSVIATTSTSTSDAIISEPY